MSEAASFYLKGLVITALAILFIVWLGLQSKKAKDGRMASGEAESRAAEKAASFFSFIFFFPFSLFRTDDDEERKPAGKKS